MKTILSISAFAVVVSLLGATVASAVTGKGNGQTRRLTGNGAASYVDPLLGQTTCNETQHQKFDTISCRVTTPLTAYAGTTQSFSWCSDFLGGGCGTVTLTFSADGLSYSGKATY